VTLWFFKYPTFTKPLCLRLNWTTENINADLTTLHSSTITTGRHIWVKPKPKSKDEQIFLQSSLNHLGVKMGWVDGYNEIKSAL